MNHNLETDAFSVERRQILKGASAVAATALAATSLGGTAFAEDHGAHHHHMSSPKNTELAKALHACVAESEVCINHCLDMFKTGDTTLANCAITVQETMAFCAAHAKLASYDSPFLKKMSVLGLEICAACEKECRKHEKHPECKACADSCVACIKACKAIIA